MPIINIPSRNVQLNFPDTMSDEDIQSAIDKEYPRNGEDVALEIDQVKNAALEGKDLVNPFDQMSNDDYVLYRKHLADKKTSFGDAIGIAKDTFSHIIDEVGTGTGATAYKLYQGEIGNVAESAKAGVIAGTIGLTDIAGKILDPAQPIPSKEDFIGKRTTRLVDNPNFPNAYPMEVEDVTTEEDYNKLIEAEKQRDAGIVNNLYAMELTMRGAPIEEVSRGFQYVDPTLLAGAGSALVKSAGKTLFTKAAARAALGTAGTVGASTAPSALGRAGLSAVEGTAGAVQFTAGLPSQGIKKLGEFVESVAPGMGTAAQGAVLGGSVLAGAPAVFLAKAKATEKVAELVGAAANAAKQEASRAGLLEQVALNPAVSPAGRKLAAGLAQIQPVGRAVLDLTKGAVKGAAAGSVVGGALGGLAERNLEGVAAGFGAGGALGGLTGSLHSAFDLGKEALGGSTSRTRLQATGDINTFISTRPEIEQGAWSDTMSKLVAKMGPERAASQLDAMRVAEASGGKIRVATPDEIKQGLAPGWVNIDGMEIVLNPEKIRGDTAAHESAHVLFNSVINRAFRPEIEAAIYGVADPVTGQIVKAGVFDDVALGKVAEQIRDAYGKNTVAANEFQGFANTLKNSTDADSLAKARSRIADEMTAAYTGRLFERTRAGRFNPDRLPLVYRKVLSAIEDGVLDKFRSVIFEKGMDLGFDNVAKTFKDKNGKHIRIPEMDAIVKKAFAQKLKTVDVANAKPDLIPINPADRALWAKTYGGAKGVLNDNGTPKSQAQIDAEAAARWQDMTSRLSALPDNEKIGIDFSRDKAGKTVMTAKGQLSPTAINAILDSGALDPTAKAVLVEILNSMQRADKSTFDTRYYGVYTRGKGGNKMVAGVKSASQNEILPYSVEINSKDGVLIRAVDMSKVRDRLATAMNKPQFKAAYGNPVDALKDLRKYMDNITQINAVDSATLLGGGVKGATKRNLFYEALGFRLRNGETLLNAPDSVVNKSQNTIKSYRAERFAKLVDSGNKFAFEEATTYERALRNFQPDAFAPESLPNGESFTNPDGYRILNKAGSKLFRTYDDTGKLIGIAESKEKAMKKAQDEFATQTAKQKKLNEDIIDTERNKVIPVKGEKDVVRLTPESLKRFQPVQDIILDDYKDRTMIALPADRMGIGKLIIGPKGYEREATVIGQGGAGFPSLKKNSAWAFSTAGAARSLLTRARAVAKPGENSIILGITAMSPINHIKNPTGQRAYVDALRSAMDAKLVSKAQLNSFVEEMMSSILGNKNLKPKIREKLTSIKSLDDFENAVNKKALNFGDMAAILPKMQLKRSKSSFSLEEQKQMGISVEDVARQTTDPRYYDSQFGDVVALVELDLNQNPTQTGFHYSYPFELAGKEIGFLRDQVSVSELTSDKRIYQGGRLAAQPLQTVLPELDLVKPYTSQKKLQASESAPTEMRFQNTSQEQGKPNASSINFDQQGLDDSPIRSILGGSLKFNPKKVNEKYYTEATKAAKAYGAGADFIQSRQSEVSGQVRDQMDRLRSEKLRSDDAILQQFIDAFPSHKVKQGGEHITYIPDDGDFVLKFTKPSDESGVGFAIDEDIGQGFDQKEFRRLGFRQAAVSEYIARTANFSKLFDVPWQVTEVVQNQLGQPVIVSVMKKIEGDVLTRDKADLKLIRDYMAKRGFKQLAEGPMTYHKNYEHIPESTYYNPNTGELISDVEPRNFIRTKSGKIEPVDLVMNVFNPKYEIRFQPDPTSPNILNGTDGSRIIKSTSGKYRVYLATGALAGVKDTLESAQKLVEAKSNK